MGEDTTGTVTVCFVSFHAYTYFAPEADAPPGGAERQLYLVGQRLKSDFDVHFVVGDFGQPRTEYRDGVTLHRAFEPASEAPLYRRLGQLWPLFAAMRRADADVYVFRGEYPKAIATCAFAKLLGSSWVYNLANDAHAELGDSVTSDPVSALFRRVIGDADHVVAQSAYQRRRLGEYGIESTIVSNGYPPIDETIPEDDREFLLYVGRISDAQKRTHRFLELARRLPEESFVLIGPPGYDDEYTERIRDEATALDNVRYLGTVDPEEIHEYYKRAIALVNTSPEEGFPNTFLEAWRAETPIVSIDVDPGRFLEGEAVGYANGDFDRFVALAGRFADDPEFARSAGERGRRCFERNYHIDVTAETYADVLRAAVGRSRAERRPLESEAITQ